MRAIGRDRGFCRHAGMTDGMRPDHRWQAEPSGNVGRQTDILIEFHPLAAADEVDFRMFGREPVTDIRLEFGGNGEDGMAVLANELRCKAETRFERLAKPVGRTL